MVIDMRVIMKMALYVAKVLNIPRMEINKKENGKIIKSMAVVQ